MFFFQQRSSCFQNLQAPCSVIVAHSRFKKSFGGFSKNRRQTGESKTNQASMQHLTKSRINKGNTLPLPHSISTFTFLLTNIIVLFETDRIRVILHRKCQISLEIFRDLINQLVGVHHFMDLGLFWQFPKIQGLNCNF